jgi:transcriptional regulator with XRE-family HTH domain
MTVNERVKRVREFRRLSSKRLADLALVSASEVSLIERQMRSPKTETLQRIAAAMEVSTSYLLSEVNADLPLQDALARESLQIFLRDAKPAPQETRLLREISETPSAPKDVKGWRDLVANLSIYRNSLAPSDYESPQAAR